MRPEGLSPFPGSHRRPKRVGRGPGSGHGKTACKGHKGQRARSGGAKGAGFEGGQMPLQRRIPKRGFVNRFRRQWTTVNLKALSRFKAQSVVTPEVLAQSGVISRIGAGVKILGDGELDRPLTVKAHAFSRTAREKIAAAGGGFEVVPGA